MRLVPVEEEFSCVHERGLAGNYRQRSLACNRCFVTEFVTEYLPEIQVLLRGYPRI
jgi:hypothetical protein